MAFPFAEQQALDLPLVDDLVDTSGNVTVTATGSPTFDAGGGLLLDRTIPQSISFPTRPTNDEYTVHFFVTPSDLGTEIGENRFGWIGDFFGNLGIEFLGFGGDTYLRLFADSNPDNHVDAGTVVNATRYGVLIEYDGNTTFRASINDGAWVGITLTDPITTPSADVTWGGYGAHFSGKLEALRMWTKRFDDAHRTLLHNSGAPWDDAEMLAYSDTDTTPPAIPAGVRVPPVKSPVATWRLNDEPDFTTGGKYQWRLDGGTYADLSNETDSVPLGELNYGQEYLFEIRAVDANDNASGARGVTFTPMPYGYWLVYDTFTDLDGKTLGENPNVSEIIAGSHLPEVGPRYKCVDGPAFKMLSNAAHIDPALDNGTFPVGPQSELGTADHDTTWSIKWLSGTPHLWLLPRKPAVETDLWHSLYVGYDGAIAQQEQFSDNGTPTELDTASVTFNATTVYDVNVRTEGAAIVTNWNGVPVLPSGEQPDVSDSVDWTWIGCGVTPSESANQNIYITGLKSHALIIPPITITATGVIGGLRLDYSAVDDAYGYAATEYQYSLDEGEWMTMADALTFTIPDLVTGTSYSVRVRAKSEGGSYSIASLPVVQTAGADEAGISIVTWPTEYGNPDMSLPPGTHKKIVDGVAVDADE